MRIDHMQPQYEPPKMGHVRLDVSLPENHFLECQTKDGPVYLRPGKPIGPLPMGVCEHIASQRMPMVVYLPKDEARSTPKEYVPLTYKPRMDLMRDYRVKGQPDAWVGVYEGETAPAVIPADQLRDPDKTSNLKVAMGALFPALSAFRSWDESQQKLAINLMLNGKPLIVTKKQGLDEIAAISVDMKGAKKAMESVVNGSRGTIPPLVDLWGFGAIVAFWDSISRSDDSIKENLKG